jgi:hypothetical protein
MALRRSVIRDGDILCELYAGIYYDMSDACINGSVTVM